MSNGIILYMSKHGSTRQYAEWLSEETGYPAIDLKKNSKPDLKDIDTIIIGSWILAARMVAHGWIKKNWLKIKEKNVIFFTVSGDVPTEELRTKYIDSSLPEEVRNDPAFFSMHGRFRKEDQNVLLRGMLGFAAKFEKEGDLANNMVTGVDGVKRENLDEMLKFIRGSAQ